MSATVPDPLIVALDTTVLRSDHGFIGAGFASLERLCADGVVKIVLPEVVIRESIDHRERNAREDLVAAAGALERAHSHARRSSFSTHGGAIQALKDSAEALALDGAREAAAHFEEWRARLAVEEIPVDPGDARPVVDAYFTGAPPFQQVKSKADFPDAFIWQAVQRVVTERGAVHVVTADGPLATACGTDPRITHHGALAQFLAHSDVQRKRDELEVHHRTRRRQVEETVMERVLGLLEANPARLRDAVTRDLADKLDGSDIDIGALSVAFEPVYLSDVEDVEIVGVEVDHARIWPGAIAAIPIQFSAEVVLDYWVERWSSEDPRVMDFDEDGRAVKDDRDRWSNGDDNGPLTEVGERLKVEGEVVVSVTIPDPEAAQGLDDHDLIEAPIISVDEVTEAAVVDPYGLY